MEKFISDLKKTLSGTFSKVAKKSGEVVEQSKYSLAISGANSDIKEEYEKIGKLIYNGYRDGSVSSEEVEGHCGKIDEKLAEIEDYRKKINGIKSTKTCSVCRAQVSEDSTFCAKCGEKL